MDSLFHVALFWGSVARNAPRPARSKAGRAGLAGGRARERLVHTGAYELSELVRRHGQVALTSVTLGAGPLSEPVERLLPGFGRCSFQERMQLTVNSSAIMGAAILGDSERVHCSA